MADPRWPTEGPEAPAPPITEAMRAQARQQPGTWIYVTDPAFAQTRNVPPWGVTGGYPVDKTGEIQPAFQPNPNYRPSPLALGLAQPVNELEGALQLAATGYGSAEALLAVLAATEVVVPARKPQDNTVAIFQDKEGRSVIPVFTSDQRLPPDVTEWRTMPVTDLYSALPGRYLAVDPGARVSLTLPGEQVIEATQPPPAPTGRHARP